MLSTTSVSDPGWAWGYMGEQDAPALEECAAGAANTLTHLCSLNSHPVHPGNPRCSEHSGCFTTISVWPHSPPWLAGSLVAGFLYHLFWVDLHVSPHGVCLSPAPPNPRGVCLFHPTLQPEVPFESCQYLAQSWTQEMMVG